LTSYLCHHCSFSHTNICFLYNGQESRQRLLLVRVALISPFEQCSNHTTLSPCVILCKSSALPTLLNHRFAVFYSLYITRIVKFFPSVKAFLPWLFILLYPYCHLLLISFARILKIGCLPLSRADTSMWAVRLILLLPF